MTKTIEVKPFLEYGELVQRLIGKGMLIKDPQRAERKLAQVGYYRLSGYWHTSRRFQKTDHGLAYEDKFQTNTSFEDIFNFYLFDKRLRVEFTDALERIEIYFRTIIAHEIGRIDPLAYLDTKQFSKESLKDSSRIRYADWLDRHNKLISESKEDSIEDHRSKGKPIPIWVAAEVWDFGALSKFYSILSVKNQDLICNRLGLKSRKELNNWLINLNGIRNRCAHHSRLCNRTNPRTITIPKVGYFNSLKLDEAQRNRFFSIVAVIWFLLKKIGPNSTWLCRIADIIDHKPAIPGFTYKSIGFSAEGFPRKLFPETIKQQDPPVAQPPIEMLEQHHASICSIKDEIQKKDLSPAEKTQLKSLADNLLAFSCEIETLLSED